MAKDIYLQNVFSPGDIVAFTAAVRDLCIAYPNKFNVHIVSRCPQLWENNPYIASHRINRGSKGVIDLNYASLMPKKHEAPEHFITAHHRLLEKHLKVRIPVTKPHGDLHLDDTKRVNSPIGDPYWLAFCGGKIDWTTKIWPADRWQKTINLLADQNIDIVQTGHAANKKHIQPNLDSALNLVGWGGLRELMWLIYHADGVICPITSGMHIAAAFNKPCVVIAGGKESRAWEAYTNENITQKFGPKCEPLAVEHVYLSNYAQLSCCSGVCWRKDVETGTKAKRSCKSVVDDGKMRIPACMSLITPEMVVEAVLSYKTNESDMKKPKRHTRVVAVTPSMLLELNNETEFRRQFPDLHTKIKNTVKQTKKCCRSTKEVLAYNKAWNDIKACVAQLSGEDIKKLKAVADVQGLVVRWTDENNKSQRVLFND